MAAPGAVVPANTPLMYAAVSLANAPSLTAVICRIEDASVLSCAASSSRDRLPSLVQVTCPARIAFARLMISYRWPARGPGPGQVWPPQAAPPLSC